jgi:hypothetical protein
MHPVVMPAYRLKFGKLLQGVAHCEETLRSNAHGGLSAFSRNRLPGRFCDFFGRKALSLRLV